MHSAGWGRDTWGKETPAMGRCGDAEAGRVGGPAGVQAWGLPPRGADFRSHP